MQTRKHPRTLQEAFGPYTSHQLHEPVRPMDWQDRVVIAGCIIAVVAAVLIGFWPQ